MPLLDISLCLSNIRIVMCQTLEQFVNIFTTCSDQGWEKGPQVAS